MRVIDAPQSASDWHVSTAAERRFDALANGQSVRSAEESRSNVFMQKMNGSDQGLVKTQEQ